MSWEALRLTSRTPSEVYTVLGPHGVEELLRDARNAVWREYPQETRSFDAVRTKLIEIFERNMKVWSAIKKPTPEAFFADLLPHAADGHVRQALVLSWMMMPRAGGREFRETINIVRAIFDRLLESWAEDNVTFTRGKSKPQTRSAARAPAARPKPPVARSKPPTARPKKAKKVSKK